MHWAARCSSQADQPRNHAHAALETTSCELSAPPWRSPSTPVSILMWASCACRSRATPCSMTKPSKPRCTTVPLPPALHRVAAFLAELAHVDTCSRFFRVCLVRTWLVLMLESQRKRTSYATTGCIAGKFTTSTLLPLIFVLTRLALAQFGALLVLASAPSRSCRRSSCRLPTVNSPPGAYAKPV
jgi:hypothetical protein